MFLPRQTPAVSRVAYDPTYTARPEPGRGPAEWAAAALTLSGKGGGGGGGQPDNPASCSSACQYCAPNQRCSFSNTCRQRYGSQFPWGCYYQ